MLQAGAQTAMKINREVVVGNHPRATKKNLETEATK